MGQLQVAMGWDRYKLPWGGTVTSYHGVGQIQVAMGWDSYKLPWGGIVTSCHRMGQKKCPMDKSEHHVAEPTRVQQLSFFSTLYKANDFRTEADQIGYLRYHV